MLQLELVVMVPEKCMLCYERQRQWAVVAIYKTIEPQILHAWYNNTKLTVVECVSLVATKSFQIGLKANKSRGKSYGYWK